MSQIHFIGGEKGGVGKSVVARLLAQYCIDKELPFLAFDTDKSHGALLRFYADYSVAALVDQFDSLDQVVEAALQQDRRVLVDLAAQSHDSLVRWLSDSGLLDNAAEFGLALTYWHVMDSGRDSVDLLRNALNQFGGKLNIVVVLNEIRGDQFGLFETSGERARAEALGAHTIRIRRLQDVTMRKIDEHSSSFWAAVHASDRAPGSLGMLERQRVRVWLGKAFEQIATVMP